MSASMPALASRAEAWHLARYGRSNSLPGATFKKLCEEVGEVGEALMHRDADAVEEELGDVLLVLVHMIRSQSRVGVEALLERALDKCEARLAHVTDQHVCSGTTLRTVE